MEFTIRKKLLKYWVRSKALFGAETWTLLKVDQKYLESFEMLCWRRMEKISLTDRMIKEVLKRVKKGNILPTKKEGRLDGLITPCVGIAF
jgi:hypothetical protein